MATNELIERTFKSAAGADVTLSPDTVKKYLVSGTGNVTDQEIVMFLNLCQYQGLNPWLKEAYLIKYGANAPAAIVVAKESFLKRAQKNQRYKGHEVSISKDGKEATAKVYVDGFDIPVTVTVEYDEYVGKKGNGEVNSNWLKRPKTMLKKVALVQALREAFPDDLGGMYEKDERVSVTVEADITEKPGKAASVKPAPQSEDIGPRPESEKTAVMATAAQLKKINTICTKKEMDRDARLKFVNDALVNEPSVIESIKDLTKEMASTVIEALEKAEDGAESGTMVDCPNGVNDGVVNTAVHCPRCDSQEGCPAL